MVRGLPDLRFVIAGRMEGPYSRRIMSDAQTAPNVSIFGEIDDDEKAALIRTSYINLTMSKLEALGLTQLEFMSAGTPVVTSGVGGQSWVVRNGHTGVVLKGPRDTKGAAIAITKLLEDPEYRAKLGGAAEKFASRLTMKVLVRRLILKIGRELAAEEGGGIPDRQNQNAMDLNLT